MNKNTVELLHTWFQNYVSSYYSDNEDINFHIKLKEDHTQRVCKNIVSIGNDLALDENQLLLAQVIALLHDIGRFEQYKKYKTFSDSKSENHATLGLSILESKDILENIDTSERHILFNAIRFHNVYDIPDDIDSESLMFSKLLRDADKLDILEILANYYKNPESYQTLNIGETTLNPGCSEQIVSHILNNKPIKYTDVKTSDDMKLLRLSWVFDINFRYTMNSIKEKRYFEIIANKLLDTDIIEDVLEIVNKQIEKKLSM